MPPKEPSSKKIKNNTYAPLSEKFARIFRWIFFGIIFLLVLFVIPRETTPEYQYRIGDIAQERLIAPFHFDVLKEQSEIEEDRKKAGAEVLPIFVYNPEIQVSAEKKIQQYFGTIKNLFRSIAQLRNSRILLEKYRFSDEQSEIRTTVENDSLQVEIYYSKLQSDLRLRFSLAEWANLESESKDKFASCEEMVKRIILDISVEGILNIPRKQISQRHIDIDYLGKIQSAEKKIYHDMSSAWARTKQRLNLRSQELNIANWLSVNYEIITRILEPNYLYNEEDTQAKIVNAVNGVPLVRGTVLKGEVIVAKGEKISPEIYRKLISLRTKKIAEMEKQGWLYLLQIWMGNVVIVAIILYIFFSFLFQHRSSVYFDFRQFSLIAGLFIFQIFASVFILRSVNVPIVQIYLVPITLAGILGYIFFDARLAVMMVLSISLLIALILPSHSFQLAFVLTSLLTTILANFGLKNLHQRRQIFQAMFFIFGGYLITIPIVSSALSGTEHIQSIIFAGINAFMAPIVTYFMIWPLEKFTHVTTDVTLFELSDLRHPLLKKLSLEAPGTFQHSTQVANLAEAAAEAIGANSILCRVGSYFHDIGKLKRPGYFIENQPEGINPHDKLTPNVSAIVIKSHMKDGLQLAKQYKLPQSVADFIPMHHGKSLISYFFNKAKLKAGEQGKINESDFRYDGPRCNTKETGIVMLCESVEAAVRSMKQSSVDQIRTRVSEMFENKLLDGDLSECPLTQRDLRKIRDAILPVLIGMYHVRIDYREDILKT